MKKQQKGFTIIDVVLVLAIAVHAVVFSVGLGWQ